MLEEHKCNVLLNLDSPFEVGSEFSHHKLNFTTQFAILEPSIKEDVKNKLLDVLIDEKSYANAIGHNVNRKQLTMREKT